MAAPTGVQHAAAEIATSERNFVEDMKTLRDVFGKPLRAWSAGLVQGVGEVDGVSALSSLAGMVERLFAPLDAVIEFAQGFLEDLVAAEGRGAWREVFERHEASMCRSYGTYVAAYKAVFSELSSLRTKSRAFEAFVRCAELQPANLRQQTLASLCIMPVQRGPRYVLLLGELRKRASKAGFRYALGDDDAALEAALECAKRAAAAIDAEIKSEADRAAGLRRVSSAFQKHDVVELWMSPSCGKTVLLDGHLARAARRGMVDSYIVLFDDSVAYGDSTVTRSAGLMMSTKATRKSTVRPPVPAPQAAQEGNGDDLGRYAFRDHVPLEHACAARGDDQLGGLVASGVALDPWEFLLILGTQHQAHVISTPTPTTAFEWVDKITRASPRKIKKNADRVLATALVWRQSKVVQADFELSPHATGNFLVARPRTKGGGPSSVAADRSPVTADRAESPTHPAAGGDLFPDGAEQRRPSAARPLRALREDADFVATVAVDQDKGLGLELRNESGAVVVSSISRDSVAADAGVRSGDRILCVGDERAYTTADVVDALRRRADNAFVNLAIYRPPGPTSLGGAANAPAIDPTSPANAPVPPIAPAPPPYAPLANAPTPPTPVAPALPPPYTPPPPPSASATPLAPHVPQLSDELPRLSDNAAAATAVAMGFKRADVARAVFAGAADVDAIVNWILDNPQPGRFLLNSDVVTPLCAGNPPPPPPPPAPQQQPPYPAFEQNPFR
ncbi:hypothetical protein CTAYLR_007870 [Chrysophaeum taylorii]|uniref:DH domain-containing protein n=1 Tax=Chrysophaeum taylorii TaxID=2483200 RepID=A0AAD7UDI3_9STRA|nr:hypothetical protein CTAYLR_007870 [Chrysophaeum taylorii]